MAAAKINTIKLRCSDDKVFTVEVAVIATMARYVVTTTTTMAATNPNTIKLISSDNKVFTVEMALIAEMARTIGTMMEDLDIRENTREEILPLPGVTGTILEKVIQWCERNYTNSEEFQADEQLAEWNNQFLQVDNEILYALIWAADYLDIRGLYELCLIEIRAQIHEIMRKCRLEPRQIFPV